LMWLTSLKTTADTQAHMPLKTGRSAQPCI